MWARGAFEIYGPECVLGAHVVVGRDIYWARPLEAHVL